ncbi:MAG TPA: heme-binding protein, partial [Kineobactrum sp.]
MKRPFLYLLGATVLAACGGGGGDSTGTSVATDANDIPCTGQCASANTLLTETDVRQVIARGVHQAGVLGAAATIAVVDRVGNVLAVYRMGGVGADNDVTISTGFPTDVSTGLEGIVLPVAVGGDALAAITKAITGAYLSSEGNAFSTRSANQIVQEHFNPGEQNQPAGPLFGVQFSQLACSDFTQASFGISVGPQRSPLGLAADPGGFPLYKNGTPVGGVGVIADGRYSIDKNILDTDVDLDEQIALAATFGLSAPLDRRADRITLEGKVFRFSDVAFADLPADPAQAADFASLADGGQLLAVPGYSNAQVRAGRAFGEPGSGIRPATDFAGPDAFVFVDPATANRYPPRAGTDTAALGSAAFTAAEVRQLLSSAITVANRSRAQIRRPLGSQARVTVSVVDSQGTLLGMLRTRDAPVFGSDVSLQKARTAVLFSSRDAA